MNLIPIVFLTTHLWCMLAVFMLGSTTAAVTAAVGQVVVSVWVLWREFLR